MGLGSVNEPWWDDRPVILVGGGFSLKGRDLSKLQIHGRVVLINDAGKFAPGDVLFTADSRWITSRAEPDQEWQGWREWAGEEIYFAVSQFHKIHNKPTKTRLTYLRRAYVDGRISIRTDQLAVGGNSGYAALNLAVLKRAKLVYLLGYDMNPGPHANWHDGYKDQQRVKNAYYYAGWKLAFEKAAKQVQGYLRVVNLNPKSAVQCFEKGDYADLGL